MPVRANYTVYHEKFEIGHFDLEEELHAHENEQMKRRLFFCTRLTVVVLTSPLPLNEMDKLTHVTVKVDCVTNTVNLPKIRHSKCVKINIS